MWKNRYAYVKSTHTDIIMWDCATGRLPEEDQDLVAPGMVCSMSGDSWFIERRDEEAVCWTKPGHGLETQ